MPSFLSWRSRAFSSGFSQSFFLTWVFRSFPDVLSHLSFVDVVGVLQRMSYSVLAVSSSGFSAP